MHKSALAKEPATSAEDDGAVVTTRVEPHLLGLPQKLRDEIIDSVYAGHDPIVRERYHQKPTNLPSEYRTLHGETGKAYNLGLSLFWTRATGPVPLERGTSETHCFVLELHTTAPLSTAPSYTADVKTPVYFKMTDRIRPHEAVCMRCWEIYTHYGRTKDQWRGIGNFFEYPQEGRLVSYIDYRFSRQELVAVITQAVVVLGSMRVSNAPGAKETKSRRLRSSTSAPL